MWSSINFGAISPPPFPTQLDAYDAITADRLYRSGMSPQRAGELLREFSGTQFELEAAPTLGISKFAAYFTRDGMLRFGRGICAPVHFLGTTRLRLRRDSGRIDISLLRRVIRDCVIRRRGRRRIFLRCRWLRRWIRFRLRGGRGANPGRTRRTVQPHVPVAEKMLPATPYFITVSRSTEWGSVNVLRIA